MLIFGETLKKTRRPLSLAALGKGLGCDPTYIHAIEKGRRLPSSRAHVERIAALCGADPTELLEAFAHDRFIQSVRRIEDDLTPELKERIKTLMSEPEEETLLAA